MRAVVSGGGTAGHIYPALAVVEELVGRGVKVEFVGTPDGLESRIVPEAQIAFTPLRASGFDRSRPLTLITSTVRIACSVVRAWRMFATSRPDVVVGFGGYASIPVGIAASLRSIPLIIHEQNSVPGMANKFLARWAQVVALTYESSAGLLSRTRTTVVTGNPVRGSVRTVDRGEARRRFGMGPEDTMLLVFGGSRGARHINQAVTARAQDILSIEGVRVVHVTGPAELDAVRVALSDHGIDTTARWQLFGYLDGMAEALAAADLVIARAGATSIAEITSIGVASILVPYPFATDDHQTTNARACVEGGAAIALADAHIDDDEFEEVVSGLLRDSARRDTMAAAARRLGRPDAASRVADIVIERAKPTRTQGVPLER